MRCCKTQDIMTRTWPSATSVIGSRSVVLRLLNPSSGAAAIANETGSRRITSETGVRKVRYFSVDGKGLSRSYSAVACRTLYVPSPYVLSFDPSIDMWAYVLQGPSASPGSRVDLPLARSYVRHRKRELKERGETLDRGGDNANFIQ